MVVDETGTVKNISQKTGWLWSYNAEGFPTSNLSQGFKVRCASNHLIVSVYRVPQMHGVGRADVLLYFKCSTTQQMRCPVNVYANKGLIRHC